MSSPSSNRNGEDIKDGEDIKSMKLYTHVERIERELAARGICLSSKKDDAKVDPFELSEVDSMHYLGNAAVEALASSISRLLPNAQNALNVLDVGSGFGGVARVLCALLSNADSSTDHSSNSSTNRNSRAGKQVNIAALELQADIHELATQLTAVCGLSSQINHFCGNILDHAILGQLQASNASFDCIFSFLVFLHIPNKIQLFQTCASLLSSASTAMDNPDAADNGGILYIEDFYQKSNLTPHENHILSTHVYCHSLPTRQQYIHALEQSGFILVEFNDMTNHWTNYVTQRLERFVNHQCLFVERHGKDTYDSLYVFYKSMVDLFQGGNLGGLRLIARKE